MFYCPAVWDRLLMEEALLNTGLSKEQKHSTVDHTWPHS